MSNVPNVDNFGAAKRSNMKKFRAPRGSEEGGSIVAMSLEIIYVYGFFFAS